MTATTPLWKRIVTGVLLYGIFCLFLWSFLLVETRSHNKLTHEPIAVHISPLIMTETSGSLFRKPFGRASCPRRQRRNFWG